MGKCSNCGNEGSHYAPPSMGEPGFFICGRKEVKPMTMIDKDLKIASEADKETIDTIVSGMRHGKKQIRFINNFSPRKVKAYIKVAKAAKNCLSSQDVHQSASSLTYWDNSLKEALEELEK